MNRRLGFEEELRREVEKTLGRRLPAESLIVDVPEPINFEVNLPVIQSETGELTVYERSRSVFNGNSVRTFVHSLRRVSLFAETEDDLGSTLARMDVRRILARGLE